MRDEMAAAMKNHIDNVAAQYKGGILERDGADEAVTDRPRSAFPPC